MKMLTNNTYAMGTMGQGLRPNISPATLAIIQAALGDQAPEAGLATSESLPVNQPQNLNASARAEELSKGQNLNQMGGNMGRNMVAQRFDSERPLTSAGNMMGGAALMALQRNNALAAQNGTAGGWGGLFGWS
jgi:hypothetical protein